MAELSAADRALLTKAAGELRGALVSLQKWVLQNMVIPDSDVALQRQLCELLTDCESAAMRAGIAVERMTEDVPAFGDRLRIPYTVGVTAVAGKRVSAKVLQVGHAWSLRVRALVKVCDSLMNDVEHLEQPEILLPTNASAKRGDRTSEGTNDRTHHRRNRAGHQRATATAGADPHGVVLDGPVRGLGSGAKCK